MNNFNPKKVTNDLIKWIQDWFEKNGKGCNAIIGISGGKDSTVVAGLCVKALGNEKVIGVLMPNGEQKDISDSKKVCEVLGIKNIVINIENTVNASKKDVLNNLKEIGVNELTEQTITNLPPRIRMTTLYAVSQTLNGRVLNTCNLSEDWIGYSTRYGDSAGDVAPLANLTVNEVRQVGLELGLPKELVFKTPSDGLCGKTDEDNLGFTYEVLDKYIRTGICEDVEVKNKIDHRHKINKFKIELMPVFKYGEVNIRE